MMGSLRKKSWERQYKSDRLTCPDRIQNLYYSVHASQHFQNTQVMVNPAGTEKMSEVIFRFVEPFKDDDGLVSKAMLEIAIIIWNASFMPSDMQRKALEDVVNVLPSDDSEARRDMFFIVNMLL